MTKTYQREDLRALLGMSMQSGESLGDGGAVRYVFRRDGLWLALDEEAERLALPQELVASIGLSDPAPKQGEPGVYGLPGQRPLLPFPFTARQLLEFDETAGGVVYERCERGAFTEEWVAELAQATGQKDEAKARHNAAELARYVMEWEPLPGEGGGQRQEDADVMQGSLTSGVVVLPVRRQRRDLLAPLVEKAMQVCAGDAAQVFVLMRAWAVGPTPRPPLVGVTEDGRIQWRDANDKPQELSRDSLRDRVRRARAGTNAR
ncbi:hypothetical protein N5C96_23945 [Delftia tsuruhatensis]|uniref:hypothetical protein n=1 Tax=Delftia tsuruhatensis TaxID=180282 RepID=UPI002443D091|nr:hypothetical protein [Delftia tsuruhatensis]MDH0776466.1 hypothetical protein [Delftia tsuruhatensis]MDH1459979.1 hypothetical protein [Delftia tsuruhatensis]MDH1822942.1 hypothetical protein [Delftia tsuruhatensis]WGG12152.1 hypothetical protein N5O86_05775 [Delftia tsuruhatensis]